MSGKEYRNMGKTECEAAGKVWVEAYMTHGGKYVHSYCRDRTHEEIERMSERERKEFEKRSPSLKGYYKGEGSDSLEAINEILRELNLPYNGGGDDFEYILPNGETTMKESEVEKHREAEFSTTVYKNGRIYTLSGVVRKEKGKWVADGDVEEDWD